MSIIIRITPLSSFQIAILPEISLFRKRCIFRGTARTTLSVDIFGYSHQVAFHRLTPGADFQLTMPVESVRRRHRKIHVTRVSGFADFL